MKLASIALVAICFPSMSMAEAIIDQGPFYNSLKPGRNSPQGCISGSVARLKNGVFDNKSKSFIVFIDDDISSDKQSSSIRFVYRRPNSGSHDFNDDHAFGSVFTMCLKPGKYYITHLVTYFGNVHSFHKQPFKIPIIVEDRKNIYIGSFALDTSATPSSCRSVPGPAYVRLEDQNIRDMPLIKASSSRPDSTPVVSIVTPEFGNPYITRCDG